jgi:hypothetical protein
MMIRTLTILSAIAAVAGPAAARDITVNIVGKSDEAVRAEILQAAKTVCRDELQGSLALSMYTVCVAGVSADAMADLEKARAGYAKATTALDLTLVSVAK